MKIRRISDFQYSFSFLSSAEEFEKFKARFLTTDLGKIHSAIPWENLVKSFKIKEATKGPDCIFSPQGKLALMFLKHYACCSDKRLVEQLNSNYYYQFFCGIYLGFDTLKNYKIVSQIRCELAADLDISSTEKILFNYWSPFVEEKEKATTDATCYESEVRYPTDQKLLKESVDWCHKQVKIICKSLGLKLPRTKYLKWSKRYVGYSKMRRKTTKKRTSITRAFLKLLRKLLAEIKTLEKQHYFTMPNRFYKTLNTVKKIFTQQYLLFEKGEKPKNRIVSINKDYLRPIVRGKEIKKVEFGAKVNKLQIDGINFIQKISFDNFNEGTQFKNTLYKAQGLTNMKIKILGADAIYATNKNRVFATSNNIQTDFKPKGRPSKDHQQQKKLKAMITKERASRLEGSFGKEKEHYHLKKIKAKTKATEILWIFFGIHTANCLEIGRRMQKQILEKVA
jgi:hypothetical protein